jgi:hypothetical protein
MKHQMRGGNFLAIFCATNIEYNCSNYFPTAHTHTHTSLFDMGFWLVSWALGLLCCAHRSLELCCVMK